MGVYYNIPMFFNYMIHVQYYIEKYILYIDPPPPKINLNYCVQLWPVGVFMLPMSFNYMIHVHIKIQYILYININAESWIQDGIAYILYTVTQPLVTTPLFLHKISPTS